jgi:hypothetical protein
LAEAGVARSRDRSSPSIGAVIFPILPSAREAADQATAYVVGAGGPKTVFTGNIL